jgi:hypothetical protein
VNGWQIKLRLHQNKRMTTPRKLAASSAPKTAAKPATRAAAAKPAARPVAKPAAKPVAKAPVKAAPKAAAKPAVRAAAKPAAKAPVKAAPKAAAKPAAKAAAKAAKPAKVVIDTTKRYKFLSGIDDSNFCQRVSDHLDAGYELAGSPTMVVKGSTVYVGQAIVRKATKKAVKRKKK